MSWHVDTQLLDRYASEELTAAGMASVEMHVTSCESCRRNVAARSDVPARDRVKRALDEQLDSPPAGWIERALRVGGLGEADARIVGATLALHGSWLVACVLTLGFVVMAAATGPERVALAAFLVAAPLVPLAGVALAYGPRVDPTFEISTATTMPGARIVVLRTLAVTAPAIPAIALLSLLLPVGPLSFAWLLPALGLATTTLALGTIVPVVHAATGLAALWLVGAGVGLAGAPRTSAEAFVGGFAAFGPSGQLLFASLCVVSLVVVAIRRSELEIAR